MIHRIHGKPPVPESEFEKAQREAGLQEAENLSTSEEARVTQPTTDRRAPDEPDEFMAWLIERGQPEGLDRPEWWSVIGGGSRGHMWGRDAWQAVRFPSREAAQAQIDRYDMPGHPFNARPVEHGFVRSLHRDAGAADRPPEPPTPEADSFPLPLTPSQAWAGGYAAGKRAALGASPPPPDLGVVAALTDLTAAYHHERKHEGRWDACQRPRCQNARLAIEGRGPFAALASQPPTPETFR